MNAHAILLSTAFRKIVFMMAQWELDRTSARYVKKKKKYSLLHHNALEHVL